MGPETQYGSREEAKSLADDFMAEKGFQNYQFSETTLEGATYVVTYSINEEHTMVKLSGNISVYCFPAESLLRPSKYKIESTH